ncbi:hypothetical protein PS1_038743 [Malus domestica]
MGIDAMLLNFASGLAATVMNPFNTGFFKPGRKSDPVETGTSCCGAVPRKTGKVEVDHATGGSYNAVGEKGMKFMFPAVHEAAGIVKIAWVPPKFDAAVACVCADGTLSLWEEVAEDAQPLQWKLCISFNSGSAQLLDTQFGVSPACLKMVIAYSDARVKFYELLNPLELKNWQLQAEFRSFIDSVSIVGHAICLSASISWNPQRGESQESSFAHQRWLPVADLASPSDNGDQVYAIAWAPTLEGHMRLSLEKIALLSGHKGEVWQMECDMSGMTLATTGNDGAVRLWQSSLNGVCHEQATFEPTSFSLWFYMLL